MRHLTQQHNTLGTGCAAARFQGGNLFSWTSAVKPESPSMERYKVGVFLNPGFPSVNCEWGASAPPLFYCWKAGITFHDATSPSSPLLPPACFILGGTTLLLFPYYLLVALFSLPCCLLRPSSMHLSYCYTYSRNSRRLSLYLITYPS